MEGEDYHIARQFWRFQIFYFFIFLFFFPATFPIHTQKNQSEHLPGRSKLIKVFHIDGCALPQIFPEMAIFIAVKEMEDTLLRSVSSLWIQSS